MATQHLWRRCADSPEGERILNDARALAAQHPALSDAELIRLAYWGVSGDDGLLYLREDV